jgi:hypothetical protein
MKKYIFLALTLSLLSLSLSAKELSKEDKKRIKTQLKEYNKNPESFQRMLDHNKQTIDSNNAELAQRKATIDQLSATFAITQKKLSDAEAQLKECQDKPVPTCPQGPTPGATPNNATVYKVQIGLYKKFDMTNYFVEPKYTGVEEVDGLHRYVFSYFTTKEEAERFVADLRKLGLRGAFVSKYENGERVFEGKAAKTEKVKTEKAKPETHKKESVPAKESAPVEVKKKKVALRN